MKSINLFLYLLIFAVLFLGNALAQEEEDTGNIFVVSTFERAFPDDGSSAEFDSLTQLFTDKVVKKNELILSQRQLSHLWGNNNRDEVFFTELASWADVEKFNERTNELFEAAWSTEEERDAFNEALGKYYTGKHSDEIYQELPKGRK